MEDLKELVNKAMDVYLYEKEPALLYNAVKHLPMAGGKRLRPIIAILSCKCVGGDVMKALPFGVALELIHTFTLVHDDIMDRDEERRGLPSVHKKYGEEIAILAGDTLFAKAFEVASTLKDSTIAKRILKNMAIMAKEICEGQEMDMRFERMENVGENQFMEMIEKKTAKMFEHAAMGGAIIGGGNEKEIEALRNYGRNLGMAFQIWDDCLDVIGKDIGKPVGSDIREGKKTLLYIYAYENTDRKWLRFYGKRDASREEINEVIRVFEESGAVEYAKNKAKEFSQNAKKWLHVLKKNEARDELVKIANFAIERVK